MEEHVDRLTAAFREIAREDAAHAPRQIDPRVLAEVQTRRLLPPAPGRWIGLGMAATLAAAISGALWLTFRPPSLSVAPSDARPRVGRAEIVTAFMPLMYGALPYTDAQIVRIEVPRSALTNFGLAPADVPADATSAASQNTVLADVIVGEDGLARAVRFVRAERTTGVSP